MYNDYSYIDPKHAYIDPESGILKNLPDLKDHDDLLFFESITVSKRLSELYESPITNRGH